MPNVIELHCIFVDGRPGEFVVESFADLPHHEGKPIKVKIEKSRNKKTKPKMVDLDNYFISNIFEATMPCEEKKKEKNTGVQVTISDDPYPVVTHLQALTREELPRKYLEGYFPKVWLENDKLFSGTNNILLEKNKEKPYSRREIAEALLHIRLAGEHLAAVNKLGELYPKYRQAATFKDGRLT